MFVGRVVLYIWSHHGLRHGESCSFFKQSGYDLLHLFLICVGFQKRFLPEDVNWILASLALYFIENTVLFLLLSLLSLCEFFVCVPY